MHLSDVLKREAMMTVTWLSNCYFVQVLPADHVDSVVLPPGDDGMMLRVSSRLRIWPVQDSHAGRYQCIASNQLGSTYSARAVVTVNGTRDVSVFVRQPHSIPSVSGLPVHAPATSSYSLNSPLSPSITPSLFHSRLKTYIFHKSFPP